MHVDPKINQERERQKESEREIEREREREREGERSLNKTVGGILTLNFAKWDDTYIKNKFGSDRKAFKI